MNLCRWARCNKGAQRTFQGLFAASSDFSIMLVVISRLDKLIFLTGGVLSFFLLVLINKARSELYWAQAQPNYGLYGSAMKATKVRSLVGRRRKVSRVGCAPAVITDGSSDRRCAAGKL